MNEQIKPKEYQCVYLSQEHRLWHDESATPIMETDDLSEACGFVHNLFQKEKKDIAVWQPRSQGYRAIMQLPSRNGKGQFCKR